MWELERGGGGGSSRDTGLGSGSEISLFRRSSDKRRGGVHLGGGAEHPEHGAGPAEVQGELQRQNCGAGAPPQGRGHPERRGQGRSLPVGAQSRAVTASFSRRPPCRQSSVRCGPPLQNPRKWTAGVVVPGPYQRSALSSFLFRPDSKPKKPQRRTSRMWRNTPTPSRTLNSRWRKRHK